MRPIDKRLYVRAIYSMHIFSVQSTEQQIKKDHPFQGTKDLHTRKVKITQQKRS